MEELDLTSIQILDLIPNGVCIVTTDLTVLAWNSQLTSWTGLTKDQVIGSRLDQHFSNLTTNNYRLRIRKAIESGCVVVFSPAFHKHFIPVLAQNMRPDIQMIQETQIYPLTHQPGQALIFIKDLTREYQQLAELRSDRVRIKEAQHAAEAANLSKSEFLANMSHEIRTPMTAILGYADLLSDATYSPEMHQNFIETIRSNGTHLLTIINDILDLSKIEAGKLTVERIMLSPCELLNEIVLLMNERATQKGLLLEIEYSGKIPATIESDPTRLRQIMLNLVGNAIKFTESGSITIMARLATARNEVDPTLEIAVRDTGIGISSEQQESLFQAFSQGDNSTTRKFGGTGLGLAISQKLAQMLGGKIQVQSTHGKGSSFTLTIETGSLSTIELLDNPRHAAKNPGSPAVELHTPAHLRGARILLVEDGPDNQRLIKHILSKQGAKVELAGNGQIGVDMAMSALRNDQPYNIILMDMQMPILDGYCATAQLRKQNYRGAIIALTAHAMDGDSAKCLAAGCDDYATKPIDKSHFFATLANILNVRSDRRAS